MGGSHDANGKSPQHTRILTLFFLGPPSRFFFSFPFSFSPFSLFLLVPFSVFLFFSFSLVFFLFFPFRFFLVVSSLVSSVSFFFFPLCSLVSLPCFLLLCVSVGFPACSFCLSFSQAPKLVL